MDNQEASHGTPSPPQPKPELPTESDPVRFMNDFEQSDLFQTAYETFYKGKNLASDVTDDEKKDAFEESEVAKLALLDFAEKRKRYRYDSSFFPNEIKDALNDYIGQTRDMRKLVGASRDEIINADKQRSSYHDSAAKLLHNSGFVGSQRLGKAFARLVLISNNLDTFESAKQNDLERLKRFLSP